MNRRSDTRRHQRGNKATGTHRRVRQPTSNKHVRPEAAPTTDRQSNTNRAEQAGGTEQARAPDIVEIRRSSLLSLTAIFLLGCIIGGITLHLNPDLIQNALSGLSRDSHVAQESAKAPEENDSDSIADKTAAKTQQTRTRAVQDSTHRADTSSDAEARQTPKPTAHSKTQQKTKQLTQAKPNSAAQKTANQQVRKPHGKTYDLNPLKNKEIHRYNRKRNVRIQEGSFTIKTNMPDEPVVTCDYRIPLNRHGKIASGAHNIVLLFPFPSEGQSINGAGKALSDHWGFTTIGIRFPYMNNRYKDLIKSSDKTRWYFYPESGAGDAWLEAIQRVREIGKLENQSVFTAGFSGGGSAANLFADAYPDQVAAIANHAGRVFAKTPRFSGPTLIMHGHHDYVKSHISKCVTHLRKLGKDISVFTFPPQWELRGIASNWEHPISKPAVHALWQWLADVANRRQADGSIPPLNTWAHRVNDNLMTSEAFEKALGHISQPATSTATLETSIFDARTATNTPSQGTIIIAGTTLNMDEKDSRYDAEYFADHGYNSIAIIAHSHDELKSLVKQHHATHHNEKIYLLTDSCNTMRSLLVDNHLKWDGVITLSPHLETMKEVYQLCKKRSIKLGIVSTTGQAKAIKKQLSSKIAWHSISPKSLAQWHAGFTKYTLRHIGRWDD